MLFVSRSVSGSILIDWISILLSLYLYFGIRSYRRLSHVPGPKLWGWTVLPLFRTHISGNLYNQLGDLNERYGPLVRIAPNTLVTSDPDVLRRMNAAKSPYRRSTWYLALRLIPGEDNVLTVLDETRHDDLRRKMGMGYAGKENVTLEHDVDEYVHELMDLIDRKYIKQAASTGPVEMDLARKIQYFTSDLMGKLAFDAEFEELRSDSDTMGIIQEVETVFPSLFSTSVIPAFVDFLTRIGILQLLAPDTSSTHGFGKILAICKTQVGKRFDSDGKLVSVKKDMLGSFLRHGLKREEAEQEGVMQLIAGSDTTATSLRNVFHGLLVNERARTKLVAEIDAAIASGVVSNDQHAIISDDQARKLPYLQACIKEGLRWVPAVAGMLGKETPPGGDTICGYSVPGGVTIAYSAKGVHHSKTMFGADAGEYRPDRWISTSDGGDEPSSERLLAMNRNNELVFGYGRYACLGKSVAAIEMNKVIFEMMRRYDMKAVNPDKIMDSICYGVHMQKNFWVLMTKKQMD